jgi:type IV secretory pathway VirB2 component (pilin)
MRKERTLFIIGIWVAVLPYLGFYESWRKVLFIITGLILVFLAYFFYKEAKSRLSKDENKIKSFIDNIDNGEMSR